VNRCTSLAGLLSAALLPRAFAAAPSRRVVYDLRRIGDRARGWYAEHGLVEGRALELLAEPLQGLAADAMEARARAVLAMRPAAVVAFYWDSVFLYRRLTRDVPLVFVNFGADYRKTPEEQVGRAYDLFRWLQEGELRTHIHREYTLEEASAAYREIENRGTMGKILLKL